MTIIKTFFEWIGFLGAIASIVGLILMLLENSSIKE
jgi:hypothetical protein